MRVKRILTLLVMLAAILASIPAAAHNLSLVGAVSIHQGEVTIRVLDVYGASPPVDRVTAASALPGKLPGNKRVPLQERSPGVYSGQVPAAGAERFDYEIEVVVMEELYRVRLRDVAPGESRPEVLMPMAAIEPDSFSWGPVIYGIAVVVVVTATVVALIKRKQARDDEEEEQA